MPLFKFNLLGNKNYTRLYIAGSTSELGSFITETALMLLVFKISGENKGYLGLTRAVFLIFLTIGGFIGGPLGNLFNKKKILIFCDVIRIPIVLSLLLFDSPLAIIWMNGLIALFTGIFNPSRQALINQIVDPKDIKKANSLFGSTMATLHLVGPFLGAWLFSFFHGIQEIILVDLVTYVVGIWFLSRIMLVNDQTSDEVKSNFLNELKIGYEFSKSRLDLLSMFFSNIVAGFVIGALIPLLLPFLKEQLGGADAEYGYMLSVFGFGGIIGGFFANKFSANFRPGQIIVAMLLLEPILMLWWTLNQNLFVGYLIFFLWGIVVFTRIPSQLNHISESVPPQVMSQMFALLDITFVVPNISSGLLLTLIAADLSAYSILIVCAMIFICLIYPRLFFKEMRYLYQFDKR